MVTTIVPRLYVRDITDHFDLGSDAAKIKKIEEVYLYDTNKIMRLGGGEDAYLCIYLYIVMEFADYIGEHKRKALFKKYAGEDGSNMYLHTRLSAPAAFLNDEKFEDIDYDEAFAQVVEFYTCNRYY